MEDPLAFCVSFNVDDVRRHAQRLREIALQGKRLRALQIPPHATIRSDQRIIVMNVGDLLIIQRHDRRIVFKRGFPCCWLFT